MHLFFPVGGSIKFGLFVKKNIIRQLSVTLWYKVNFGKNKIVIKKTGGVVKVEIYEVDTKIALYVDTF